MISSLKFHQSLLLWSGFHHIVTKLSRNCVFTFVGEHDFWFLHLTTFKARFLHLRLGLFVHYCGWRNFYSEGDFYKWGWFSFICGLFLPMKFFNIFGCNTNHQQYVKFGINHSSKLSCGVYGCPEGCVVSPILFSIYTNFLKTYNNQIR